LEDEPLVADLDERVLDRVSRLRAHHDVLEGEPGLNHGGEPSAVPGPLSTVVLEMLQLLLGLVHFDPRLQELDDLLNVLAGDVRARPVHAAAFGAFHNPLVLFAHVITPSASAQASRARLGPGESAYRVRAI